MRKVIIAVAASLIAATPALANEARVEARGGVYWQPGTTEATAGIAAGYDFDLGPAFAGLEVSGDKVLNGAFDRVAFGFTGRLGTKLTPADKIFAAAGYTTKPCALCAGSENVGAGYEHSFGPLYGKVEYRHFFANQGFSDSNAVAVGVGMHF